MPSTDLILLQITAEQTAQYRVTKFFGRDYAVVPAVLVRSQVLHNNVGRTFLPSTAITPEWAQLWNAVPVLVGPHPRSRGMSVSGRNPDIINARGAGFIFNAKAEKVSETVRRLVGEVWIDLSRENEVPGLKKVLEKLKGGGVVELSTGFPSELIAQNGEFEGKPYDVVIQPTGVDHLVVSTEMTGACSVAHGCGLGTNSEEDKDTENALHVARKPSFNGTEDIEWKTPNLSDYITALGFGGVQRVADLSNDERRRIAEHSLLGDPLATTIEELSVFPVVNPHTGKLNSRALRAVLAGRGGAPSIHNRSKDSAKIMARRLLRDEYASAVTSVRSLARRALHLFQPEGSMPKPIEQRPANPWQENIELHLERLALSLNGMTPSDQEHAQRIQEALQSKFGGGERRVVVTDVYSATTPRQVVFYYSTPFGPQPAGSEYFRSDYDGDEQITFKDPVLVRRMTMYEEVPPVGQPTVANAKTCGCKTSNGEQPMLEQKEREGLVAELTTSLATKVKEEVANLGTTIATSVKEALAPVQAALKTEIDNATANLKAQVDAAIAAVKTEVTNLSTTVNAEKETERVELVAELKAKQSVYNEADLQAMKLDDLRKLAKMVPTISANFAGRGGPRSNNTAAPAGQTFMPVRPYYEKPEASTTGAK